MVVDGCQQSSELLALALSGRPEGSGILFSSEPTTMIQHVPYYNSWALFRTRVSPVSFKRISQVTGSVKCPPP
jgi:hypothetical protein